MTPLAAPLQAAIDSGEALYPVIVCQKKEGSTKKIKVYYPNDIDANSVAVDSYASNGDTPQIGTTVSSQCTFTLYQTGNVATGSGSLSWFGKDSEILIFVGARSVFDVENPEFEFSFIDKSYDDVPDTAYFNIEKATWQGVLNNIPETSSLYQYRNDRLLCPLGTFVAENCEVIMNGGKYTYHITGLDLLSKLDVIVPVAGLGDSVRLATWLQEKRGITIDSSDSRFYDYVYTFENIVNRISNATGITILSSTLTDGGTKSDLDEPEPVITQPYAYNVHSGIVGKKTYRNVLQYIGELMGGIFITEPGIRNYVSFKRYEVKSLYYPASTRFAVTTTNTLSCTTGKALDDVYQAINGIFIDNNDTRYKGNYSEDDNVNYYLINSNPFITNAPRDEVRHTYADDLSYLVNKNHTGADWKTWVHFYPMEAEILQRPNLNVYDTAGISGIDSMSGTRYTAITHYNYRLNGATTVKCVGKSTLPDYAATDYGVSALKNETRDETRVEMGQSPAFRHKVCTARLTSNVTPGSDHIRKYTKIGLNDVLNGGEYGTDNALTFNVASNSIVIGKGINKVLVSAKASFRGHSYDTRYLAIVKNFTQEVTSVNELSILDWNYEYFSATVGVKIISITPTLAEVKEGDVISLVCYLPDEADIIEGGTSGSRTSLTIETVE